MKAIHKHYDTVAHELEKQQAAEEGGIVLPSRNHAVVLVSKLHLPTLRALAYARATRPDELEAITVSVDDGETRALVHKWEDSDISVPLKVIASPYREITRPVLDYVKRISKESPRTVVTVFIPEYVVGHWWEQVLHNQSALRLKGRLLFMPNVMVTSVPWQLNSSERLKRAGAAVRAGRRPPRLPGLIDEPPASGQWAGRTDPDHRAAGQRGQLRSAPRGPGGVRAVRAARRAGPRAGGRPITDRIGTQTLSRCSSRRPTGSIRCVRSPVSTARAAAIWRSPPRTPARRLKGAVVANQLAKLGGYRLARRVRRGRRTGRHRRRDRLAHQGQAGHLRRRPRRLPPLPQRGAGHRPAVRTAAARRRSTVSTTIGWPPGAHLHVALDDDGVRHVVQSGPRVGRRTATRVVEGSYEATQRVNGRVWRVPVTAFWQAHRDAARVYSQLVAEWAQLRDGMVAWDLYGGAGLFAAVLGEAVGESGHVVTVDTSRGASRSARAALADLSSVSVVTDSVRRALAGQSRRADVAVLDPPRSGAGREVIDLLAAAEVPRIIHIGCEAASFARDVGLYLTHGYRVEELRVFDSFPLTHHIESVAVLTR